MKLFLDIRSVSRTAIPLATAALLASSCNLMHDDLPACATRPATRASVNFIYDYNTADEDRFASEVGSVTLYVYDAQDHLVTTVERTAADGLHDGNLSIPLELPYGTYHLYASARASEEGYDAAMLTPGAKFRRTPLTAGDALESLVYSLDNNGGLVENGGQPLEDMWLTREPATLTLTEAPMPAEGAPQPEDVTVTATVPLQRVTNTLHVAVSRDNSADANLPALSESDYEIWVETRTGRHELDLLGRPTAAARTLRYTPHSLAVTAPVLNAEIRTSRLMRDDDPAARTQLCIRSRLSGETTVFDLPEYLHLAHGAYADRGWSHQEYLDRETDHYLAVRFRESDEGWRYIEISIPILNWAKRIQNVEL